jgi:hypothetical protein
MLFGAIIPPSNSHYSWIWSDSSGALSREKEEAKPWEETSAKYRSRRLRLETDQRGLFDDIEKVRLPWVTGNRTIIL